MSQLSPEEQRRFERAAAVACGESGEKNCRHDWNRKHPEDPVTEQEQREFEKRMVEKMKETNDGDE